MEKIKSNYLYIKVLDVRTNENFSFNFSKNKNSKFNLNKGSQKFLLNFSIRNIETNNKVHLNNDPLSFEFKDKKYILKEPLNMIVYEKPISIIKEYLEISLIFDHGNNQRKENFVVLKSFGELKTGEIIQDMWQIKNFNILVLYEFRCNVLIESPKKMPKNRIPLPNNDPFKRKIARHESQILECDSKKLKKIPTSRKNSETDEEQNENGKNRLKNRSLNESLNNSKGDSYSNNKRDINEERLSLGKNIIIFIIGLENINIKPMDFKTNDNPFNNKVNKTNSDKLIINDKGNSKINEKNNPIIEIDDEGNKKDKIPIRKEFSFIENQNQNNENSSISINQEKLDKEVYNSSSKIKDNICSDFSFTNTFKSNKNSLNTKVQTINFNNADNESLSSPSFDKFKLNSNRGFKEDETNDSPNCSDFKNHPKSESIGNLIPLHNLKEKDFIKNYQNSKKDINNLDVGQILNSKVHEDDKFFNVENINNLDILRGNNHSSDNCLLIDKIENSLRETLTEKRDIRNSSKSIFTINSAFTDLNETKKNKIKLTLNSQNTIMTNYSGTNNTIEGNGKMTQFTVLEHDEIDLKDFNRNDYGDSYCEAFFHAGLIPKKVKMIPDSDTFIPPCKHKNCAILNAYRPEIIESFPGSVIDGIEINSTTASLCFPYGIKICYCEKENDLKPQNSFSTIITNEAGEQRYLTITHFYQRIDSLEFEEYFEFNPIKDYFKMTKNIELIENTKTESQRKAMENKLKKNFEICTNFINNTYVYFPNAICLISKYPFTKQMEKTLESLFKIYTDQNSTQKDINNLLVHIIEEIPIPPQNKKLNFYLPYSLSQIEIYSYLNKNLPYISFDINKILENFSSENSALIIFLILFEQKILFVCEDYSLLSEILLSFITLIYPFEYVNILIPILSEELVKYLQCFRPFIMGIDESMLETAKSYIEDDQTIFLIHIKKDLVEIYSKKKLKKATKKSVCSDNENGFIPIIPDEMFNEFKKEISSLRSLNDKNKKNRKNKHEQKEKIKIKLKKFCIKLMAFIFGDYKKYVTFIDKLPIFNAKSFVSSKPLNHSRFYEDITGTHIFKYFLQISTQENFPYFEKLCIRYSTKSELGSSNTSVNKDKNIIKSRKSIFFLHRKNEYNDNKIDISRSSSQNIKNIKREATNEKNRNNIIHNDSNIKNQNLILFNNNNNSNSGIDYINGIKNENSNLKSANISDVKSNFMNDSSIRRNSDSNSYSNSKSENTETNKVSGENDNFMILPYFINSLLNSEISKIEFYISEKIKNLSSDDLKIFETKIIPLREGKKLNVTESPSIIIRYKFNNWEKNIFTMNINPNNDQMGNQSKLLVNLEERFSKVGCFDTNFQSNYQTEFEKRGSFGKDNSLVNDLEQGTKSTRMSDNLNYFPISGCEIERNSNPLRNSFTRRTSRRVNKDELESKKEKINDFLRSIYSSEQLSLDDKKCFDELFSNRMIRGHFAQLIFQDKFKNEKTHVLNSNVFEDFYQMIFTAILNCENSVSQFEIVRLLTKSSFYYYKILDNKQRYYIYQEIAKKQGYFSCWQNQEFWTYWFNSEIKGKSNTFSDWEEFYFTILIEISTKMKDLNISYKIIHFCIIENIALKFLGNRSDLIMELELITKKQHKMR